MDIKNIRVDSRGIHGQVAVSWIPNLMVNRIIVVDNDILNDNVQKNILKMAKPQNVKLSIISINRFKERLLEKDAYLGESIMVIFTKFSTIYDLIDFSSDLKEINLANISNQKGYSMIKNTVYLSDEEIQMAEDLQEKGVKFYHQMVVESKKEYIEF